MRDYVERFRGWKGLEEENFSASKLRLKIEKD